MIPRDDDGAAELTVKIDASRINYLRDRLDKINKRARKLNVPGVDYTIGAVQTRIERVPDEHGDIRDRVIAWHDVTYSTAPVKLAGWTFTATLDHTSESGVILRTVPGETIPPSYRDASNLCDHCGTKRRRNETFICRHDDGTYKQIGRQCLRDFLGMDPARAVFAAEICIAIGEALESEYSGGGGHSDYVSTSELLTYAAVAIRCFGWRSRKTAREFGAAATADDTMGLLFPPKREHDKRSATEREQQTPTDTDKALADSALEWARSLRDSGAELSDYQHNICVVASGEVTRFKSVGIGVSIIPSYQRFIGEEIKRRQARAVSNHVGEIGKRAVFADLTVDRVSRIESQWGVTTIVGFIDPAGNRLTWFASNSPDLDQGEIVTLKATVKEHGDYKGIKQTTITRASIISRSEAA